MITKEIVKVFTDKDRNNQVEAKTYEEVSTGFTNLCNNRYVLKNVT